MEFAKSAKKRLDETEMLAAKEPATLAGYRSLAGGGTSAGSNQVNIQKPAAPSPIADDFRQLFVRIEKMGMVISELEQRLEPCLMPQELQPERPSEMEPPTVIQQEVQRARLGVEMLTERLAIIYGRLAL